MHTSTVTVAVLEKSDYKEVTIYPGEVHTIFTKDSGSGGQHRNKTESCVVLTHMATGIRVKNADTPSQHKNKRAAWVELTKRVNKYYRTGKMDNDSSERREQIGSGNRGDHRRTYNVKTNTVTDHDNNKTGSLKNFMRGNLTLIK